MCVVLSQTAQKPYKTTTTGKSKSINHYSSSSQIKALSVMCSVSELAHLVNNETTLRELEMSRTYKSLFKCAVLISSKAPMTFTANVLDYID